MEVPPRPQSFQDNMINCRQELPNELTPISIPNIIDDHRGIADRAKRIEALNTRWEKLNRIVEARSLDPEFQKIPGGDTGLLCRRRKLAHRNQKYIPHEYVLNVDLLRELRAIERQAADEVNRVTKDVEDSPEVLIREYVGVDIDLV